MPNNIIIVIAILCLGAATQTIADTQQEIAHLLNFVANTTCQYERNGTMHDGVEAQKHIKKSTTTIWIKLTRRKIL